jgi:hypothetical protein
MPLVPWVPLLVSEEYWAVQPHNSRHTLAFHTSLSQMVPPALLVVVQQMVGQQLVVQQLLVHQLQVEIQVGIQLLLSLSQATMSPARLLPTFQSHH